MTTDPNQPHDPNQPSDPNQPYEPNTPPSSPPPAVGPDDPYAAPPAPGYSAPPPDATSGYGTPPPAASGYSAPPAGAVGGSRPVSKSTTSFDPKSLSTAQWLVIGGAVAYLIALILPWWSLDAGSFSVSISGFDNGLLVFAWILFLAAAALVLLPSFGVSLKLPVPVGLVVLGLTGLGLLFTVIRFFNLLGESSIGKFVGLLAAIAAVAGAFKLFQAERGHSETPTA